VGGECGTHDRKVYKVLVGKPEGKRPLGRPRRRWDQEGSWGDWLGRVEWTQVAQIRGRWWAVVNAVKNVSVLTPRS
jgi:hypothetical protein